MSDIVDKVQALLAQAEHPNTGEAEAQAFFAKAQELMTRHAIDEAMFRDRDGTKREVIVVMRVEYSAGDQNVPSKRTLLMAIAKANSVKPIFHQAPRDRKTYTAQVVGTQSDIDFTMMLYASAAIQCSRDARRAGMKGCAEVTGFMMGFANGVASRLEKTVQAAAGDNLPVLFDRRREVDAAFAEAFPSTRKLAARATNWRGFGAGQEAGRNADLSGGRTQVSRQRKALT